MKGRDDFVNSKKPWEVEGVEWREVRLEEICERRSENLLPAGKSQIYVGLEHINSGEIKLVRWGYSNKVKSTKYKFYPGDILYGKLRPYLDKAVICGKEGICSTDFIVITPRKSKVLPFYLIYFLHTKSFVNYSTSMMKGVHLPRVSWTIMKKAKIPLPFRNGKPDLETQKKIVEYIEANFSRIDKILEKKKKELELLDELWENALEQAFKPKEGEEWREVRLGEIAAVIGGSTAPQDKKFYKDGKFPFVRVSDLGGKRNFNYILNTRDKLNEEGVRKNKLVLAPKDTIVFPKSGAAILTNSRGILGIDAYIVNHLAGVTAYKDKAYPRYLLFYLSKLDMGVFISPDSSYPSLKLETIKNLKIPIPFCNDKPDLEKQKQIADYLDSVYEKIKILKEKIQHQIEQLEEMKESILDGVFGHISL